MPRGAFTVIWRGISIGRIMPGAGSPSAKAQWTPIELTALVGKRSLQYHAIMQLLVAI
jgi:hypothetical protein